uniref:Uncharacterized protein n=1 Tax=Glossina pallidipes TaxID=7398 RepID=A0A1B0ABI8_GLOPL
MKRTFAGNLQQLVQQLTHRSPAHMHNSAYEKIGSFSSQRAEENKIILTQTTLFISLGSKQISGAPTQEGHIYAYYDRILVRQRERAIFMCTTIEEPGTQLLLKCFLDLRETKKTNGLIVKAGGKLTVTLDFLQANAFAAKVKDNEIVGKTKVSRMGKNVRTNGLTTQDCNITTIKSNNTSLHTEARME